MQTLTKAELESRKEYYERQLKKSIFIYPTDTIYGVGCNALDGRLIERIRDLKGRYEMPFSIIAPNKEWVREHCEVTQEAEEWLEKLPGPYTLILNVKKHEELPRSINPGRETLGVRIPDHWIRELVERLKTPIITTSANRTGENHMRTIEDLPAEWREDVDYVLYEGEVAGTPSTIIDLTRAETEIKER